MREQGLEIKLSDESRRLSPVKVVETVAEAEGKFDLVLFAVKGYDTEEAALALRPVVGESTSVLTLQNGVESADRLAALLVHSAFWRE